MSLEDACWVSVARRSAYGTCIALLCVVFACGAPRAPAVGSAKQGRPNLESSNPAASPSAPHVSAPHVRLFAGNDGSCALAGPGQVRCWGSIPVEFDTLATEITAVDLDLRGDDFVCAFDAARTAHCLRYSLWNPVERFEPIRKVDRILPFHLTAQAVLQDGSVCLLWGTDPVLG